MENRAVQFENMRKALRVNAAVYDAVRGQIRPGISEQDVYDIAREIIEKEAGAGTEFVGDFVGGLRSAKAGGGPTDYVLCPGDLFILDLSVKIGNAWSDTCRTYFLGEPSKEQEKAYHTLLELQDHAAALVRPGTAACMIKEETDRYLEEHGYGGRMRHHAGHAIGEKPNQEPDFRKDCSLTVEEGMAVTLEPGIYFPEQWGMRVENDYLVTADGLENIFVYPRELDRFICG